MSSFTINIFKAAKTYSSIFYKGLAQFNRLSTDIKYYKKLFKEELYIVGDRIGNMLRNRIIEFFVLQHSQ